MRWLSRLVLRARSSERVVLERSRWPALACGLAALLAGAAGVVAVPLSRTLAVALAATAGLAMLGATARRRIVVDLREGVVQVEERWFGVPLRRTVPLFHVRAVMIVARGDGFAAFLQTRVGDPIELDEARTPQRLVRLAEALTATTDWRLIYGRAS